MADTSPNESAASRTKRLLARKTSAQAGLRGDREQPATAQEPIQPDEGLDDEPGMLERLAKDPDRAKSLELGDVLWLEDGTAVIYRQPSPEDDRHFVYQLSPSGLLEARAVVIGNYNPKALGHLDRALFREMIREKKWERDAIVFHLAHWTLGRFLPSSNGARLDIGAKPPAPTAGGLTGVRRGARVTILNGARRWEAIYWGRNVKGDILAHATGQSWQLTHVDLKRFGDRVSIGETLPPEDIEAIAEQLMASV